MTDLKVGGTAPDFKAQAVGLKEISLADYKDKKNVLLFFFPGCFSPVCSLELTDFERNLAKFKAKDVEVIGCSVDSIWSQQVFSASVGGISYPVISDIKREISTRYGVFLADRGIAARSAFLIGKDGSIKWLKIYELSEHPNIDEILKPLDSL